jgi:hypothetical protein
LFKNPSPRQEAAPGERVRTRVLSRDDDLDFEIAVSDPNRAIKRIRVSYMVPDEDTGRDKEIEFTLEAALPPLSRR